MAEEGTEKDFVLFVDSKGNFKEEQMETALISNPTGEDTLVSPSSSSTSSLSKGAIDEETGEINWDCPCLQSALAPPCGEFFREAFSCFVSSKTEPKGSDCLEKFSAMQDCFRAHPEVYLKDTSLQDEEEEQVNTELENVPISNTDKDERTFDTNNVTSLDEH